MKQVTVKMFGVTREITGKHEMAIDLHERHTVQALRQLLAEQYPALATLKSLFIAVNNEYANDGHELHETDEIALIPPVSGG